MRTGQPFSWLLTQNILWEASSEHGHSISDLHPCSLPAATPGPHWAVSSHGQDRPHLPLSNCPSSPGTETADLSVSSARGPLWHLHTRHGTLSPVLAETTWVKDHEKGCLPRSIKPFCTYSLPLFLVSKLCFIFFMTYGTWINAQILNIPGGILHLNRDSLQKEDTASPASSCPQDPSLVTYTCVQWPSDVPRAVLQAFQHVKWQGSQQAAVSSAHWQDRNSWLLRTSYTLKGLPWWLNGKEPAWQCRRCKFKPWLLKIPWRRKWQPTPVFLPRESRGQRRATVCVAAKIQTGPGDWTTKEQSILRWKMDRREKIILGNSLCLWLLWKQNYWAKLTTMI